MNNTFSKVMPNTLDFLENISQNVILVIKKAAFLKER